MNVLMGKAPRTQGHLYVNGVEGELSQYKQIIGFVPQEDIMHRELTVRENIYHSARVRLPSSWTDKEVDELVTAVIGVLNLSHVQHTQIGDENTRGVSGGQRKRVNIGMELVALPLVLFLDEPTSGLDSTASLQCMDVLKQITSLGITVVSVIHQPRYEIFAQFDTILMLAVGGRTAYLGPATDSVKYFTHLGHYLDPQLNPADVLMDLLSDKENAESFVADWKVKGEEWKKEFGISSKYSEKNCSSLASLNSIISNRGAGFMKQIQLCHDRSILQQFRKMDSFFLELFVSCIAGIAIGLALLHVKGQLYIGTVISPFEVLL